MRHAAQQGNCPRCQGYRCCGTINLAAADKPLLALKRLHCATVTSKWCRCKTATLKTLLILMVREVFFQLIFQMVLYAENGTGLNITRKIIETQIVLGGKKLMFNVFFLLN
jgi:hypothetical protein